MAFPSTISSFPRPTSSDRLDSPSHSDLHNQVSSALAQVETFIGTTSSAVGTLMYDIRSADSNGGGHVQSANKGGTGQTTYTKGDILVASSSSVLSKLAVSSVQGYALITDSTAVAGVKWGLPGNTPVVRTYVASAVTGGSSLLAIWNKPSTLSYAVIEVVGGGGGGGGANSATSDTAGGGGGGGGGYSRKTVAAADLPLAASVIGGLGGVAGANTGGNGGTGGTTRFGSVITATGGTGGTGATEGTAKSGGEGGVGSSGDINVRGVGGGAGFGINVSDIGLGGTGGASYFGDGGWGVAPSSDGRAANFGGGGGGAAGYNGTDAAGGTGGAGVIIVTEY